MKFLWTVLDAVLFIESLEDKRRSVSTEIRIASLFMINHFDLTQKGTFSLTSSTIVSVTVSNQDNFLVSSEFSGSNKNDCIHFFICIVLVITIRLQIISQENFMPVLNGQVVT